MKFYLEEPTLERKNDVIDYLKEFEFYHSPVNGSSLFENILYGESYEECFRKVQKLNDREYATKMKRLPGKTFFFIRKEDHKIIGMINIRYRFDETIYPFRGHIGYSIRPTERRKGYNKIQLYCGLKQAKEMGLEKVKLCCEKENIGSNRSIKALGGILEACEIDPSDQTVTNVYQIDIANVLNQCKETYERFT